MELMTQSPSNRYMTEAQSLVKKIHEHYREQLRPLPNKKKAHEWIDRLIDILFPVRCAEAVGELEIRQLELQLWELLIDRKSTRLNSSHPRLSRMPSSA